MNSIVQHSEINVSKPHKPPAASRIKVLEIQRDRLRRIIGVMMGRIKEINIELDTLRHK